jgi:hypothetical protein
VKRYPLASIFVFTALLLSTVLLDAFRAKSVAAQHGFSVKEYESFHDVLHPLEHEALPKGDFKRIRSQASLLVKRGNAIIKLGVPSGTSDDKREEFVKELDSFRRALAKFKADAKTGTNDQLKTSYSSVHDSFEMLAGMLR